MKLLTWLQVVGASILVTLALAESRLIPFLCTLNPKNVSKYTPKVHFKWFILSLYYLQLLKTFSESITWLQTSIDFTAIIIHNHLGNCAV